MKINFILFIPLMFLLTSGTYAQQKPEVTGQVKDAATKKNMEFCSVSILNTKDSLITGCVTDNSGYFTIELNPGMYNFVFSFMGYKTDTLKNQLITQNKFVGIIKMQPDEKMLKEFTVKTNSSENLIDRDVQVVTDKLKAGTANTKEVLDKLNGVDYDRYNNSIKVDNDAKVMILVDGVEKDQEYVKNLAPDRLKKIEVIRDPGGRYALEGYSAVINIILKKDYQGTELYIAGRSMNDPDASESKNIFVQNSLSATLNYTYNKINIYGKAGLLSNNFNLPSVGKKEYSSGLVIESTVPAGEEMNTFVKQFNTDYTLGADWYINPKHTLSFESGLTVSPKSSNTSKEAYNVSALYNGTLLDSYQREYLTRTENQNGYGSLFYKGKLNDKNELSSNFTFTDYKNKYTNNIIENIINIRNENGTDEKNSTNFYLEYDHTINSKSAFQFGYGNAWSSQNNVFNTDETQSSFTYTDFRNKFYSYYSWQKSKKFGIKLGGVGETSAPVADGQKKDYLIVQPYADFKFLPHKQVSMVLKYRAGSSYPTISQTNPFKYVIDQQTVRVGNPLLKPEVTHKVSLKTDIMGGLLSLEPYYHFSNNYITETGTLRPDSIFEYSYSNSGDYKNYGLQAGLTIPFSKSLILQTNFDFFKSSILYNKKTNALNDWSMNGQLIYIREKSNLVSGIIYQNNLRKFITAQGYNSWDNDFWLAFVQKSFMKKRLEVMLLYFMPVNLGVQFDQGSYISTTGYT
ncbi:MAG: outer membrane beta-barrel protein, partial [Bacteroidota bacterium]